MGHPLTPDLTQLSLEELNQKYTDLMSRYNQAFRWGRPEMTQQLQLMMQDYQGELDNRNRKQLEELEKNSKTFKKIIDIQ